jgi:hypothetical protein
MFGMSKPDQIFTRIANLHQNSSRIILDQIFTKIANLHQDSSRIIPIRVLLILLIFIPRHWCGSPPNVWGNRFVDLVKFRRYETSI